jgi:hypothetical protein
MKLIRQAHPLYDLQHLLSDPRLLLALLGLGSLVMLVWGLRLVYVFIPCFLLLFAVRSGIGRRCPHCDGPLTESDADRVDGLTFDIAWRCARDGYQEIERMRGGKGSWGDSGY